MIYQMHRLKARALAAALGLLLCAVAIQGVAAGEDFLPADSAFSPSAQRVNAREIAVRWKIADGYYLYRHAFRFAFIQADGIKAAPARIPPGKKHRDKFFGKVETYRHNVRVLLPAAANQTLPDSARVKIVYQGCADAGICYPPQTKILKIAALQAARANSSARPASAPTNHSV